MKKAIFIFLFILLIPSVATSSTFFIEIDRAKEHAIPQLSPTNAISIEKNEENSTANKHYYYIDFKEEYVAEIEISFPNLKDEEIFYPVTVRIPIESMIIGYFFQPVSKQELSKKLSDRRIDEIISLKRPEIFDIDDVRDYQRFFQYVTSFYLFNEVDKEKSVNRDFIKYAYYYLVDAHRMYRDFRVVINDSSNDRIKQWFRNLVNKDEDFVKNIVGKNVKVKGVIDNLNEHMLMERKFVYNKIINNVQDKRLRFVLLCKMINDISLEIGFPYSKFMQEEEFYKSTLKTLREYLEMQKQENKRLSEEDIVIIESFLNHKQVKLYPKVQSDYVNSLIKQLTPKREN